MPFHYVSSMRFNLSLSKPPFPLPSRVFPLPAGPSHHIILPSSLQNFEPYPQKQHNDLSRYVTIRYDTIQNFVSSLELSSGYFASQHTHTQRERQRKMEETCYENNHTRNLVGGRPCRAVIYKKEPYD